MRSEKCVQHKEPLVSVVLDTVQKNKQALVFVNTKRSAEKVAEDIAKKLDKKTLQLTALAQKIMGVLDKSTHQCERLAACVGKGVAFHHAGLHAKQKELVEDAFREGTVKIICCTPTLAAGMDLPAFRAIIRDVKRFGDRGLSDIPVLEYLQMAGRAGRPRFDAFGESIIIAATSGEKERVWEKYVEGFPEDIYSKLAVEPVLRMYVLSLVATRVVKSVQELYAFFGKTFWAFQYKDVSRLEQKLERMLALLEEWEFVVVQGESVRATLLGTRVAQLYVDPLTAHQLMQGLHRAAGRQLVHPLGWLHLVCCRLEMQPLLKVRAREFEEVQEQVVKHEAHVLEQEPSMFDMEYEEYLHGFKTALMLHDWIEEKQEEFLLEKYESRPGETRVKIETADWLLYAAQELARMLQFMHVIKDISKVRFRLKYGVKEELLALLRLQDVGRVRARKLFNAGVKMLSDVRTTDTAVLAQIVGPHVAASIKKQVMIEKEEQMSIENAVLRRPDAPNAQ